MCAPIAVARCFLLKNIHISCLNIHMRCDLVANANEKTILIKRVVHNLFSKVKKDFIDERYKWSFGY